MDRRNREHSERISFAELLKEQYKFLERQTRYRFQRLSSRKPPSSSSLSIVPYIQPNLTLVPLFPPEPFIEEMSNSETERIDPEQMEKFEKELDIWLDESIDNAIKRKPVAPKPECPGYVPNRMQVTKMAALRNWQGAYESIGPAPTPAVSSETDEYEDLTIISIPDANSQEFLQLPLKRRMILNAERERRAAGAKPKPIDPVEYMKKEKFKEELALKAHEKIVDAVLDTNLLRAKRGIKLIQLPQRDGYELTPSIIFMN